MAATYRPCTGAKSQACTARPKWEEGSVGPLRDPPVLPLRKGHPVAVRAVDEESCRKALRAVWVAQDHEILAGLEMHLPDFHAAALAAPRQCHRHILPAAGLAIAGDIDCCIHPGAPGVQKQAAGAGLHHAHGQAGRPAADFELALAQQPPAGRYADPPPAGLRGGCKPAHLQRVQHANGLALRQVAVIGRLRDLPGGAHPFHPHGPACFGRLQQEPHVDLRLGRIDDRCRPGQRAPAFGDGRAQLQPADFGCGGERRPRQEAHCDPHTAFIGRPGRLR
jgi:hypothetical protein